MHEVRERSRKYRNIVWVGWSGLEQLGLGSSVFLWAEPVPGLLEFTRTAVTWNILCPRHIQGVLCEIWCLPEQCWWSRMSALLRPGYTGCSLRDLMSPRVVLMKPRVSFDVTPGTYIGCYLRDFMFWNQCWWSRRSVILRLESTECSLRDLMSPRAVLMKPEISFDVTPATYRELFARFCSEISADEAAGLWFYAWFIQGVPCEIWCLPNQSWWSLRFPAMLRSIDWWIVTDFRSCALPLCLGSLLHRPWSLRQRVPSKLR